MKKILAACVLFVLLPLVTTAATTEEIQTQIQALLQQINTLQQSLGQPTQTTSGAAPATGGQCPLISRTLKRAATGDDVRRLQQFLARDPSIYPEAQVTGYYGALTEAAVKKFQCKNQIVCDGTPESTGYGVVGPRTAAILALQCPAGGGGGGGGGSGTVSGFVRVSPTAGNAPLNVAIETHTNIARSCTGGSYELLYGDNSPAVRINVPAGSCNELVQTYTYTYRTPGTYTVILRSGAHQITSTVTVGGQAQNTDKISATPVSGAAPLNVSLTGRANGPASCSPASYSIQFGDNTSANIPVTQCSVSTFAVTHTYQGGGNFVARLMRGNSEIDSVGIVVSGNPLGSSEGGGPFTATPGYGGDAFAVQAVFQLASSCTAYDIDWGDGTPHSTQGTGSCQTGTMSKEVTHTYSGNGSYTITLKRGAGSSQTTDTASVVVSY